MPHSPLDDPSSNDPVQHRPSTGSHESAVTRTLREADTAATNGDFATALSWLGVLEAIGERLPAAYHAKRRAWSSMLATRQLDRSLNLLARTAQESIGARYAAIAVLDHRRTQVEHFATAGIDATIQDTIGIHPRGRGVLGLLLLDPKPLRIANVAEHPRAYGFPAGHPPMQTFLGVPILIHGEPCGNLYLADKHGGAFTTTDERAATTLAATVATAVEHARKREPEQPHEP